MKRMAGTIALMLLTTAAAGAEQGRDHRRPGGQGPTPADVLRTYDERHPERIPLPFTVMRIGTWNTMLQPWLSNQDEVVRTIARTDLDVLALQEVWTEAAKEEIVTHPTISRKYPYSYYTPPYQTAGASSPSMSRLQQERYISCLLEAGVDTRTVEQPEVPIPETCQTHALGIMLASQTTSQCLQSTMQELPAETPFAAIDLCAAGQGANYAHGGNPGLLVLSKRPLTDLLTINYITYGIRRVNLLFTISGVRVGFTHFPSNVMEDINPILGPLQTGALQAQLAQDLVITAPGVLVGDFNSGPNYQPKGYNTLVAGGYKPLSSWNTYCPSATHEGFPQCQLSPDGTPAEPRAIDNIFIKESTGACLKAPFALQPASDHIGLAALCVLKKQ